MLYNQNQFSSQGIFFFKSTLDGTIPNQRQVQNFYFNIIIVNIDSGIYSYAK